MLLSWEVTENKRDMACAMSPLAYTLPQVLAKLMC